MIVTYNQRTKRYQVTDSNGNWYPESTTMLGAIQHGISVAYYWNVIAK